MKEIKVVVFGQEEAGKRTLIKKIKEKAMVLEHDGETICLDYCSKELSGKRLHFFGMPVRERLCLMKDTLSEGMDCGILVVDAQRGLGVEDMGMLSELEDKGIPYVLFINKTDVSQLHSKYEKFLDRKKAERIYGAAEHGKGVKDVLKKVARLG